LRGDKILAIYPRKIRRQPCTVLEAVKEIFSQLDPAGSRFESERIGRTGGLGVQIKIPSGAGGLGAGETFSETYPNISMDKIYQKTSYAETSAICARTVPSSPSCLAIRCC